MSIDNADNVHLCEICRRVKSAVEECTSNDEAPVCQVCLGLFTAGTAERVTAAVAAAVDKYKFRDMNSFQIVFTLPGSCTLRQCRDAFVNAVHRAVDAVHTPDDDAYVIALTFSIDNLDECCDDASYVRTLDKQLGDSLLDNRTQLVQILQTTSTQQVQAFDYMLRCVPRIKVDANIERRLVIVGGRYNKFSRYLPQTRFTAGETATRNNHDDDAEDDDTNLYAYTSPTSVAELIARPLCQLTSSDSFRFVASGREDIDVRMLGTGRPFAISLVQCRDARALDDMSACARTIHECQADMRVRQLQRLDKADLRTLRDGETDKIKSYTALCESTVDITSATLMALAAHFPLVINQRTPIRVLKRRALLERPRTVHFAAAVPINSRRFVLHLRTQAGTYVKEFVHGDFGRTRPALGDVLGLPASASVDIVELDVQHVHLDNWPPTVAQLVQ